MIKEGKLVALFKCRGCGESYPINSTKYLCDCGGHFLLEIERSSRLDSSVRSMWRYAGISSTLLSVALNSDGDGDKGLGDRFSAELDVINDDSSKHGLVKLIEDHAISLGEGLTPQIRDATLTSGQDQVDLKLDFLNPTLSYKDRGSTLIVSAAKFSGVQSAAVDSSGNAAVSLSAYCARAGISLSVYVPEGTSRSKIAQIKRFGGIVNEVPGDRSATSDAIMEDLERHRLYYMSHIYNPLFHHGTKSLIYELAESNGGVIPDEIIIPAGNGTLLLGVAIALSEMAAASHDFRYPRVVVVQARAVAPIYNLLTSQNEPSLSDRRPHQELAIADTNESNLSFGKNEKYQVVAPGIAWIGFANAAEGPIGEASDQALKHEICPSTTLAEGIAIAKPPRLLEMATVISSHGWPVVVVDEDEIMEAKGRLSLQGVDVEDTAAATYAGALKWIDFRRRKAIGRSAGEHIGDPNDRFVSVIELTGAGLKSPYLP